MEDRRIYLMAQFDKATDRRLADVYGRLVAMGLTGEQTTGIPYHITIGSFAPECEEQVLKRLQSVSLSTKAFDVNLSNIGLFGQRVLFIAPSINTELLNLHDDLIPSEPMIGCHNWVAHVTIFVGSPDEVSAATPIVAQSFSPFPAKIESVAVFEFFPSRFIGEYKLGTPSAKL